MPLKQTLNPDDIWTLGALALEQVYLYGDRLVKAGDIPEGMYVIVEGDCQVLEHSSWGGCLMRT